MSSRVRDVGLREILNYVYSVPWLRFRYSGSRRNSFSRGLPYASCILDFSVAVPGELEGAVFSVLSGDGLV